MRMKKLLKFIVILVILLGITMISLGVWLKTSSAKNQIEQLVTNIIKEESGLTAKIDNLELSLPLIATIDKFSLSDQSGTILEINGFNINILPSLFSLWEVIIWSISADEIHLMKMPEITPPARKKKNEATGFFNPNIVVQHVNIKKITLDPKLTNTEEIITHLNAYINFNNAQQNLELIISTGLEQFGEIEALDNSLELLANIDFKQNSVHIKSLKLESDILSAHGNDIIIGNQLSGQIQYSTNALEQVLNHNWPGAKGAASGAIKFTGSKQEPEILASGNIGLNLPENDFLRLTPISWDTHLYITNNNTDISGVINLTQGDIVVKGLVGYLGNESKIYCKNLQAIAENFVKTVNLTFDLNNNILIGKVSVIDKNLQETSKLLPFLHSGFMDLTINYSSPNNKTQHVSLTGQIKHLSSKFGQYGLINLNINSRDLWSLNLTESNIDITSLSWGNIDARNVQLKAHTQADSLLLNGSILAHQPYPVAINFTSSMQFPNGDEFVANIEKLKGKIGKATIANSHDIIFKYNQNESLFKLHDFKVGDGLLDTTMRLKDNNIQASIKLTNIPTNALPNILPASAGNASINGTSNLSGNIATPYLETNFEVQNISLGAKEAKPLTMQISSIINTNSSNFNIAVDLAGKNVSTISAKLPSTFTLSPFEYKIHGKKPFSATLSTTNDIDILSLVPAPPGHLISGKVSGTLEASGSLESIIVNGGIILNNGEYSYRQYGLELKNIESKISAHGDKITFDEIKAKDVFSNQVNGSGSFSMQNDMPFNIALTTEKFNLINTPYIHGEIKGNIDLTGNDQKAAAKGKFALGPLEIKIPEHFQQDIPALTIIKNINENQNNKEIDNIPYELTLDITLKTDDKVFIRGWGVDALLGGKLHVTGPSYDPIINGLLRIERGKYQEFGKLLNIKGGALIFDGPISPSPYMNIVATATEGSTDISLILAGSIQSPDITIESIPAMSSERALSMLLFGENPENISTFQALQLADSLRRLSGKGGGFDPLGLGRKILGVDEISFKSDADDPEKSSVGVGKHVTDKVYIEIEKGRHEGSAKTKIEVQITPKISIESTTEQEGNNSLGVNWRFDY